VPILVFDVKAADSRGTMNKRSLTERDICTKFILPAVKRAGWDEMLQVREEVYFTKGRIIVRGKLVTRGKGAVFCQG
jgi:type I site-specific restriction endonuclease